jgi:transposase
MPLCFEHLARTAPRWGDHGTRPVGSRASSASTGPTRCHGQTENLTEGGIDKMKKEIYEFLVGIDWAYESHQACVVDREGSIVAQRVIEHSGTGITAFIDWLLQFVDEDAGRVAVAIERPHGALVEMLLDRDIAAYSINPKQLDRFRDRHTVAGAKDDRRDAYVLGDSLRTDLHLFRRVKINDPLIIQLREFSRMQDDLQEELGRLSNRLREQVYRFFPQMLELCSAANKPWFWDLLESIPTPAAATSARPAGLEKLLREHRIRRFSAEQVLKTVRSRPVRVAEGTTEAARVHIQVLLPRLRLVHAQLKENKRRIEDMLERIGAPDEGEEGPKREHRDVELLLSVPGIGIGFTATMLGEAAQAIADRDYQALRKQTGVAPVTRRSGKQIMVSRRYACNSRAADAMYHAARVYSQVDPRGRELYHEHRKCGHSHGRALRSIGDRLLRMLVAMLNSDTLYDPNKSRRVPPDETLKHAA